MAPAYQGKGLGRAGVSSALDAWAAISAPENPRVWIRVAADDAGEPANVASAALAVSLGFEREPGLVRLPRNQRRLRQPQSPSLVAYSRLARPAAVFEPKSPAAVFEPKSPAAAGGAETFSFPEQLPVRVEKVPMSKQQYRQYLMAREKESAEGGGGGGGTRGGPRPGGARPPPPLAMPGSERDTGSTYYVQSRMFGNYAPPRQYMPTSSVLDPSSITGVNVADLPDDAFTKETSPKLALMMENIASGPGNRFLIYSQFKGIGGLAVAERFLQLEGFERFELPAESSGSAKKTGGDAAADRPAGYRPDLDEGAIVGGGTSPLWVKVFGDYDPAERDLVSKVLAMQDAVHTDASRVLEFTPADLLMDLSATPPYPDLPYRDSRDRQAFAYTNLHRGQRKLFLTELYLLSTELAGHNEPCLIVYAGAATGHHLPLLSRLFPKAVFHLYDPAPFSKIVCKMKEVFHVYNDYFTDETAESWGPEGENSRRFGRPDFFICDIRLDAQSGRKDFENAVRKDMLAQQLWTRLMHPTRAAMLKFRLPYLDPEGAEDEFYGNQGTELYYLRGKVLWQCWPPRLSGETRLIINTRAEVCVEGKIPTCRYPLRLYESRTYTHNIIVRPWVRYLDRDLFRSIEGYDGSWDSRAEAETWVLYAKNAAADLRSTSLDAFIAKHMNRLSRELSQGLIQKKQGRGGSKVTGTLHGHFPRLIGTQFAEALAQRVREGSVGRRRLRHMTHQMKNSPAVHEELLQASVYFPMSREWLRLIDPVAGAAQPFDPSRDLRIDCDDERPVPLPVPKKIPLQAVGLSLPRRSTAVALIYFMADKIPARQISERNRARTVTLTGPITTISKNLPKLLAQLFPMVTLLDAPEMRVFRLNTDTKSVAAWDLTYHANSTVCDRCHSDKKGSQTTSLWGCWSPETAPAAHYHICQGAPGLADPKPIEPCEITEHSLSVAAAHLIYDRCWSRYQVPRSKLFGEQKLETVPGYDGCWDCTAEAHTWLRYMRFRHEVVGTVEAYVAGDYMRVLGDVLGEPLNPVHSGHGRFVSPRARAANLAAGYTIATSRRAARKAKQANSKAPGARVGGGEEPAAEEPAAEEPAAEEPAAEEPAAEEPPAAQQLATPPRIPRYVVIHGEVPDTDRTRIQKIWQSPENRYGEIIRGILVTKAGALGLDLSGRQIHILEPYWDKSLEAQAIARFRRINALDYLPPEERTIQPYLYLAVGNPEVLEGLPPDVLEVPVALAGELPRGTTVDVAFHEKALQTLELNEDFRELIKSVSIECALYRDPAACRICRPTGAPLYHSTVEEDLRLPDACDPIRATEIQAKSVSITLADGTPATYHYVEDPTAALGYRFYSPDATLGWSRGETYVEVDPATSLYLDLLRAIGAV